MLIEKLQLQMQIQVSIVSYLEKEVLDLNYYLFDDSGDFDVTGLA